MFYMLAAGSPIVRRVDPCLAHHNVLTKNPGLRQGWVSQRRMGTEMPMLGLLITLTSGPINNPGSGLIVLSRVIQWTMALEIRGTAL